MPSNVYATKVMCSQETLSLWLGVMKSGKKEKEREKVNGLGTTESCIRRTNRADRSPKANKSFSL
jgi:hypothetical protein